MIGLDGRSTRRPCRRYLCVTNRNQRWSTYVFPEYRSEISSKSFLWRSFGWIGIERLVQDEIIQNFIIIFKQSRLLHGKKRLCRLWKSIWVPSDASLCKFSIQLPSYLWDPRHVFIENWPSSTNSISNISHQHRFSQSNRNWTFRRSWSSNCTSFNHRLIF